MTRPRPARSASREPIATTSHRCDRCIAGITLLTCDRGTPEHAPANLVSHRDPSDIRFQSSSTSAASPLRTPRRHRRGSPWPTDARDAAAWPAASSSSPFDGEAAASRATRTIALTCDSSVLWAASTTAPWKSRSAARRASGSAHAASTRRSFASISANCSSVRRAAASRARGHLDRRADLVQLAQVVAPFHVGEQPDRRRRRRAGATPAVAGRACRSSGRTSTSPLACSTLIDSRTTVRLTPSSAARSSSFGSGEPADQRPPTTSRPSSSTTRPCSPRRG